MKIVMYDNLHVMALKLNYWGQVNNTYATRLFFKTLHKFCHYYMIEKEMYFRNRGI